MSDTERTYPRKIESNRGEIELRLMTGSDGDRLMAWARELPKHDLLFLRRDITRKEEIAGWLADIESGYVKTLLAFDGDQLLGYATMHRSELGWSAHVAELRVVVAPEARGVGLGRLLTQEVFALALTHGIEKIVARMTLDQEGARKSFEGLGFKPEALLRDHVKDRDGNTHDLLVMCHAVEEFQQTLAAYGVTESVG